MTDLKAMTAEELLDRFQHCCHSAESYAGDPKAPDCSDLKAELLRRLQPEGRTFAVGCPKYGAIVCHECDSKPAVPHRSSAPATEPWPQSAGPRGSFPSFLHELVERCVKAEERVKELEGQLSYLDQLQSDYAKKYANETAVRLDWQARAEKSEAERDALSASPAAPDDLVLTKALEERDEYEEFIGYLALEMGCPEEWSNLHDHRSCVMRMVHELQSQLIESRGPAAVAETTWVSVEERLPELTKEIKQDKLRYSEDLLVWDGQRRIQGSYNQFEGKPAKWVSDQSGCELHGVTYWQPLPSPPAAPAEDGKG